MNWYISNHRDASFSFIPKFHKWGKYVSVRLWKRELVISFGQKLPEDIPDDKEIVFGLVPSNPEDGVLICLSDFISYIRGGFLTDDDGVGFYADTRFQSDIAVNFEHLRLQAEMFVERKRNNRWYPTHVVWYNK